MKCAGCFTEFDQFDVMRLWAFMNVLCTSFRPSWALSRMFFNIFGTRRKFWLILLSFNSIRRCLSFLTFDASSIWKLSGLSSCGKLPPWRSLYRSVLWPVYLFFRFFNFHLNDGSDCVCVRYVCPRIHYRMFKKVIYFLLCDFPWCKNWLSRVLFATLASPWFQAFKAMTYGFWYGLTWALALNIDFLFSSGQNTLYIGMHMWLCFKLSFMDSFERFLKVVGALTRCCTDVIFVSERYWDGKCVCLTVKSRGLLCHCFHFLRGHVFLGCLRRGGILEQKGRSAFGAILVTLSHRFMYPIFSPHVKTSLSFRKTHPGNGL